MCFFAPLSSKQVVLSIESQRPCSTDPNDPTDPSDGVSTLIWLVVSTHLKNISQIGNLPQIGVKIKNLWNHHLVMFSGMCWESFFPISGLNNFIPTAVLWSISTATSCKTAGHHGFSMDVLVREENKNERRDYAKTKINTVLIPNYKFDRFASAPHISSWCKTSCLVTIEWALDIRTSPSNTNDMSLF